MIATGGLAALNRLSAQDLITLRDHARAQDGFSAPNMLDAHQFATVTVAAELIIPASDSPGATRAGVAAFIDTMLGGWYPASDRDRFRAGLKAVDARSASRNGKPFVAADSAAQLTLLESFDNDVNALRVANDASANQHWFAMLKFLTVWGYCTSEVGMRDTLKVWPLPMRYDGNAAVSK